MILLMIKKNTNMKKEENGFKENDIPKIFTLLLQPIFFGSSISHIRR